MLYVLVIFTIIIFLGKHVLQYIHQRNSSPKDLNTVIIYYADRKSDEVSMSTKCSWRFTAEHSAAEFSETTELDGDLL